MSMTSFGSASLPQVVLDRTSGVLDSWKTIASHLGRTVRTVQRWHRHEGMPVYHHLHRTATTVYALRDELDQWRLRRSQTKLTPSAAGGAREKNRGQIHFITTVPSNYFRSSVSLSFDSSDARWEYFVDTQTAPAFSGDQCVTLPKKPRPTLRVMPLRS